MKILNIIFVTMFACTAVPVEGSLEQNFQTCCDGSGCWSQSLPCGGGGGGGGGSAACDAVNCSTDAQCRPLCGNAAVCVVACNADHPEQCSGWCWP